MSVAAASGKLINGSDLRDRYLGCMYGLAIGDAIGFPVEFLPLPAIQRRYGPSGIVSLPGAGWYSDDTQMSLATADGLIAAKTGGNPTHLVYREWGVSS